MHAPLAPSGSTNKQKVGSAESKIRRSKVSVNRDTKMIKLAWVCSNSDDHGSTTTTFDNGTDFIQGMVRYMKLPTIGYFRECYRPLCHLCCEQKR